MSRLQHNKPRCDYGKYHPEENELPRIRRCPRFWAGCLLGVVLLLTASAWAATPESTNGVDFPRDLQSYSDGQGDGILSVLIGRVRQEPFNLVATLIFLAAIVHTFLTGRFMAISHRWTHDHEQRIRDGKMPPGSVHHGAELFHFLGEVEAVFGIWAVVLMAAIVVFFDGRTAHDYIVHRVNFTEAIFVVVIMVLAATRPILRLSESIMRKVAGLTGGLAYRLVVVHSHSGADSGFPDHRTGGHDHLGAFCFLTNSTN